MMHIVEITTHGAPEVLRVGQRPVPQAGEGELLIRVSASGVNRPDVLQRMGHYPVPAGASDVPGLEVAGVIESGDADALAAADLKVGDRVCALVAGGGYAQYCVAPVAQCLPVPAGLSDVEAASLPETFFTVWSNVFDRAHLQAGETLLVQGGTSGIGVAAIQLAKAFGARLIATASWANCSASHRLMTSTLRSSATNSTIAVTRRRGEPIRALTGMGMVGSCTPDRCIRRDMVGMPGYRPQAFELEADQKKRPEGRLRRGARRCACAQIALWSARFADPNCW